jgi:hypothetical protein
MNGCRHVVLDLFQERIGLPREPTYAHPRREVLAFDLAGRDLFEIRRAAVACSNHGRVMGAAVTHRLTSSAANGVAREIGLVFPIWKFTAVAHRHTVCGGHRSSPVQKLSRRHSQTFGKLVEGRKGDVLLSALDGTDVGPVELATCREGLL